MEWVGEGPFALCVGGCRQSPALGRPRAGAPWLAVSVAFLFLTVGSEEPSASGAAIMVPLVCFAHFIAKQQLAV